MNKLNIVFPDTKPTIINWHNNVKQIVDGYRSYNTISHGIQKDAIQNSWDARVDKKGAKDWGIEFELIEGKDNTYLVFTDRGTTGLTGKILMPKDLESDLPIEERWGRFENVAFTKDPSEHALGARGRGKFIFVGGSKYKGETEDGINIEKLILYDTFRKDKIYRFGLRFITLTDSRLTAFEGKEAEKELNDLTSGSLKPLTIVGTRIIIVDPLKEIIDDIENGNFIESIEETWWEIIRDLKVKIKLKVGDKVSVAKLNSRFNFPESDDSRYKVWKKENIKLPKAPNYKIKTLHIVYDSKHNVEESLRGISIQRGGMKVCSIPVKYIDKEKADSVYGYIKLDTELEKKMQEDEGIEHYSFDFTKQTPKFVKQFIEDEIEKFLREKLGIETGGKTKIYEKEKSAELKALYQVNRIAKDLGITGKGLTGGDKEGRESMIKPLRLSYGKMTFPNQSMRVNYSQSIENIKLLLINDTQEEQKVGIRFSILFDEDEEVKVFIDNMEYVIGTAEESTLFELDKLIINQHEFPHPGKYTFFSKLVSLNDDSRGRIIHVLSKNFWVEENPPQKGIFEEIEAIAYPDELKTNMGEAAPTDGKSYKFIYNSTHPAKKKVENDENELTNYLIELMCTELAWIDLRNEQQKIFSADDLESQENIVRRVNKFLGEIKYKLN